MDYLEVCKSMSSHEIKKDTREIKSEAAQHSAATAEGDMMEINRVDEESVMNNTTEVVEPGSGTVVMTPTYGSKDQDKLLFVAEPLLEPLEHSGDDPSQVEGEARLLAYPRIAVHLEELAPIKPKVLLSCNESTYRTNNLPWKMAKRRMRSYAL